jgi:hypothetical protein
MGSFWREIVQRLIGSEIEASVALVKIQSAIVYLHVLKNARRLTQLVCLLVFFVIVLACGFLLIPVALVSSCPGHPIRRQLSQPRLARLISLFPFWW